MTDESNDNGSGEEPAGWFAQIGEISSGLVDGVRSLIEGDEEGSLIGRWTPVIGAARDVLRSFAEVGWYLARESIEETDAPPEEFIGELSERTRALIASFPTIAELYDDVDAFDRRLRDGLDKSGADATLFAYLEWLKGFVEAVLERAIEVALDDKERRLSPERTAEFLERVDDVIRVVLERWVFPSIIERGPRRRDEK